jgi:UDP-N-acetylglucosamine 2-epimerase (non-hydrolysing)
MQNVREENMTNMIDSSIKSKQRLMVVFGTRQEAIKLAPVIHELKKRYETIVVCTNQHVDLLNPLLRLLEIYPDYNLRIMTNDQTPHQVCSKILQKLDKIMAKEKPDLALMQGDTTTTLAAALSAFYHRIPVGHIEAGLRSGNVYSLFPEEMNRQLVSKIATFHFAATNGNRVTY